MIMNNLDWNEFKQVVSDYVGVDADEITRETDVFDDLYLDSVRSWFTYYRYLQA